MSVSQVQVNRAAAEAIRKARIFASPDVGDDIWREDKEDESGDVFHAGSTPRGARGVIIRDGYVAGTDGRHAALIASVYGLSFDIGPWLVDEALANMIRTRLTTTDRDIFSIDWFKPHNAEPVDPARSFPNIDDCIFIKTSSVRALREKRNAEVYANRKYIPLLRQALSEGAREISVYSAWGGLARLITWQEDLMTVRVLLPGREVTR